MIKNIVHDREFLSKVCEPATPKDSGVLIDLYDTITANNRVCIGMAANMIGVAKRIIVVEMDSIYFFMLNPEIVDCYNPYTTEEGCLSHVGLKSTLRYETIKVKYYDPKFKLHEDVFTGLTAQVIQHEIDHCNGILI